MGNSKSKSKKIRETGAEMADKISVVKTADKIPDNILELTPKQLLEQKFIYGINDIDFKVVVEKCVKEGVDVNLKRHDGCTALMTAACNSRTAGTENTVQMLLDAGADTNLKRNDGCTALMMAALYSRTTSTENTVQMLLDAGADVNLKSNYYRTPLMEAAKYSAKNSSENTVRILLTKRHNLLIRDRDGKTAWDLAKEHGTQGTLALIEHALNQPDEPPPGYAESK